MPVRNPFQVYSLSFLLTELELEMFISMIRHNIPEDKFTENLIMKLYDECNELLTKIRSRQ